MTYLSLAFTVHFMESPVSEMGNLLQFQRITSIKKLFLKAFCHHSWKGYSGGVALVDSQ